MERAVKILMRRDRISQKEAIDKINDFLSEVEEYVREGDEEFVEELLMDILGLEPDYLLDLFF